VTDSDRDRILDNDPQTQQKALHYDAVTRVYDDLGNVIETHEHKAISCGSKFWLASVGSSFLKET